MYVKQAVLAVLATTSLTVLALPGHMGNMQDVNVARDEVVARKPGYMDPVPRAQEVEARNIIDARKGRGGGATNRKPTEAPKPTTSKAPKTTSEAPKPTTSKAPETTR